MNCDRCKEQILLYLSDGLDTQDQDELESHLGSGCPRCLEELTAARETLGRLPLALDPVRPPAAVKHRLRQRIAHHDEHDEAEAPNDVATASSGLRSASVRASTLSSTPSRPSRRRHRRMRAAIQILSPAASAVLAGFFTYLFMTMELRDGRQQLASLTNIVDELKANLGESTQQLAELKSFHELTQGFLSSFGSSHSQQVPLWAKSHDGKKDFWGSMLLDYENHSAFCLPGRSARFQRNARYSMWFFVDDESEPVHAAEFTFDNERWPYRFEFEMPEDVRRYSRISVRQHLDNDADEQPGEEVFFGILGSHSH
jgi:hypothetical protein